MNTIEFIKQEAAKLISHFGRGNAPHYEELNECNVPNLSKEHSGSTLIQAIKLANSPQTFLTKGGNILLHDAKGRYSFHTPELNFIREVTQSEGEYILSQNPTKIEVVAKLHSEFIAYAEGIKEFPKWKYLFSVTETDDSNYYWAHSNNGGKYSKWDEHNYFVRLNGDKVEFMCLTTSGNSSEFPTTWDGRYQSNLNQIYLIDVEGDWSLAEQCYEDCDDSIHKFGVMCQLEDLFLPVRYTSSNYDQEYGQYTGESETTETPITFAEFLNRWRIICKVTSKSPRQLKPKTQRRVGKRNTRR